ncbi:MAG: hypothetical protein HND58_00960 [Planctomycetota bacterium]|nr:MAG: hypothetical protein HND58_00960 [Planctomycetota bacterium]
MHNPDAPAIPAAIDSPLTLRDFLTDGSLARLCTELGRIAGTTIELRDEPRPPHHRRRWRLAHR